jgi:hypothetical protein
VSNQAIYILGYWLATLQAGRAKSVPPSAHNKAPGVVQSGFFAILILAITYIPLCSGLNYATGAFQRRQLAATRPMNSVGGAELL